MRFGRDQSRFFPPRSLLTAEERGLSTKCRAKVKLPTSVWLHASDDGGVTLNPTWSSQAEQAEQTAEESFVDAFGTAHTCPSTPVADDQPPVPHPTIHVEEEFAISSTTVVKRMNSVVDAATAVELWRNLELGRPPQASSTLR